MPGENDDVQEIKHSNCQNYECLPFQAVSGDFISAGLNWFSNSLEPVWITTNRQL